MRLFWPAVSGARRRGLFAFTAEGSVPRSRIAWRLRNDAYLAVSVRSDEEPLEVTLRLYDAQNACVWQQTTRPARGASWVFERAFWRGAVRAEVEIRGGAARFRALCLTSRRVGVVARLLRLLRFNGPERAHVADLLQVVATAADRELIEGALGAARRGRVSAGDVLRRAVRLAGERPVAAAGSPAISLVVPVYNTKPAYLDDLLASLCAQPPGAAEVVFCDDGSDRPETLAWLNKHATAPTIRVVRSAQNCGIAAATNRGIHAARGAWVALLDHDDALTPFAVDQILAAIQDNPECQFLYTDEVVTDGHLRPQDLFLKPAWDPVLLSGVNYINHLSCYRRERLLAIGGLREGFQGSQDYDLLLRYLDGLQPGQIVHLPYPAYLWRRDGASFSATFEQAAIANARRALSSYFEQDGSAAIVEDAVGRSLHRVRFDLLRQRWPKVSVVIPSRDGYELIRQTLDGLRRTDYPDLEIIVVDNGSRDARVLELYHSCAAASPPFRVEMRDEPFNFSRAVNRGVALAKGDYVLLLNNDVEMLERAWLKEMVACFEYPKVGIVGAKLLYPTGKIQHAGVIAGFGGLAGHWFHDQAADHPGPMGRLWVRQSLSAVTGACMLISRECLNATGAFDEVNFAVAYNDVDYCLRAAHHGYRVIWTPFAQLVHHESATRGSDERPENRARFAREKAALEALHATSRYEDAALNPWYSKTHSDPHCILLDRLPNART